MRFHRSGCHALPHGLHIHALAFAGHVFAHHAVTDTTERRFIHRQAGTGVYAEAFHSPRGIVRAPHKLSSTLHGYHVLGHFDAALHHAVNGLFGFGIASFSHGMKQKVALIAAWVHQPKLVIMDEPFVGLDPTASHLLKQMMRELCEEGGAIFFSTHVLEVAEKLCDHIAIIKEGKLLKTGTMEEVKGDASLETVFLEMENESV